MREIYQDATNVLSWLGPDTEDEHARIAADTILAISEFLFKKPDVSVAELRSMHTTCHELVMRNRAILPLPSECDFSKEENWDSLRWYYSHLYFTRVWVIHEIGANKIRKVQCGYESLDWERVDLVAGYMMMDTAFSKPFGFTNTNCWFVSTMTELTRNPKNWPAMLYLASTYSCLDPRDSYMVYEVLWSCPRELSF